MEDMKKQGIHYGDLVMNGGMQHELMGSHQGFGGQGMSATKILGMQHNQMPISHLGQLDQSKGFKMGLGQLGDKGSMAEITDM